MRKARILKPILLFSLLLGLYYIFLVQGKEIEIEEVPIEEEDDRPRKILLEVKKPTFDDNNDNFMIRKRDLETSLNIESVKFPINEAEVKFANNYLVPSFIIIGAQKCGTTSLFSYLLQHHQMLPLNGTAKIIGHKEIRFFDTSKFEKGVKSYLPYFPSKSLALASKSYPVITGEASPGYIFSPGVAKNILKSFPKIKIIAMLRNPIDRAYSHYQHAKLSGDIYTFGKDFSELVSYEIQIIQDCMKNFPNIFKDTNEYQKFFSCHFESVGNVSATLSSQSRLLRDKNRDQFGGRFLPSIPKRSKSNPRPWSLQMLIRGIYAPQILQYTELFPWNQTMIIKSENFYENTPNYMDAVSSFLGIKTLDWDQIVEKKYNFAKKNEILSNDHQEKRYPDMDPRTRESLEMFFRPFNQELKKLVGFSWED